MNNHIYISENRSQRQKVSYLGKLLWWNTERADASDTATARTEICWQTGSASN